MIFGDLDGRRKISHDYVTQSFSRETGKKNFTSTRSHDEEISELTAGRRLRSLDLQFESSSTDAIDHLFE